MAQSRQPGPQGIGSVTGIDHGTLALARSPARGIDLSGQPGGKQGLSESWPIKRARAYSSAGNLVVAEVYFKTNDDEVDHQDALALTALIDSLNERLKEGFKCTLVCTGGADHRGTAKYNMRLGGRRAVSVMEHILLNVSSPNLTVVARSIGESRAAKPVGRKKVPPIMLMNNRKVVVTLGPDELIPPVNLSVTGNWILNKSIEKEEINNRGKVVAHPGSAEAMASKKESDYMGRNYDPKLPVATVQTRYNVARIGDSEEATVNCDVVYNKTGQVLFRATARTNPKQVIKEHLQYHPDHPRVKRVIDPKTQTPLPGYVVEESTVAGVKMRALHLFDSIYAQLKGRHKNITARIAEELDNI